MPIEPRYASLRLLQIVSIQQATDRHVHNEYLFFPPLLVTFGRHMNLARPCPTLRSLMTREVVQSLEELDESDTVLVIQFNIDVRLGDHIWC